MMVPLSYRLYDYKGTPTPTLEQYMTTRMKTEIFGIKREIWRSWRQNSQLLREAENTELRAQIFFDDLFDKTEIFFNQTLPQHCDKFKHFVENARTPPGKIGELVMSHLLPVQMDTLIKFLRFLRCSWTTEPNWAERFFEKWANEYDPESPTGLEGVDFGEDAVTIQDNILDQVIDMKSICKNDLIKRLHNVKNSVGPGS